MAFHALSVDDANRGVVCLLSIRQETKFLVADVFAEWIEKRESFEREITMIAFDLRKGSGEREDDNNCMFYVVLYVPYYVLSDVCCCVIANAESFCLCIDRKSVV